ncbi:MAG: methionine--tRNA ligase [Candidatus Babeliales bacterium]
MAEKNKFYITTPIYYGTAKPHLGSLYSTLLADVFTRWHKLQHKKTFFLTGTDEHGQKVAQAAEKAGKDPKKFVDSFIPAYKTTWHHYELEYNKFIRTTDPEHIKAVQYWIKKLLEKGDIYKSMYSGWYCTPCETFVTDEAESNEAPLCSSCNRQTNRVSEESYFFRLSAYQDKLLKFYKDNSGFIIPKERASEVIRFVESGLRDLSISRTTISWGIPFPNDPEHVVYVWADALNNYISAIGYGDPEKQEEFNFWWPADMQVLGKDIIRFHAVYWPAFLMAADLQLPKRLLVHGWIKVNQQKMSKSLGNVVDPDVLFEHYGADPIRYYLIRHMAINHDTDFSIEDLEQRIASDLADDLGNLLNRMLTLAFKYNLSIVHSQKVWTESGEALRRNSWDAIEDFEKYMNEGMAHMAVARLWRFINQVNSYFHAQEPWQLAKNNEVHFAEVISAVCHSLYDIGILMWPIMPKKMEELLKNLGVFLHYDQNYLEDIKNNRWDRTFNLFITQTLFEKPHILKEESITQADEEVSIEETKYTTIDEVQKVELRVGTIEECEPVVKSDKLLKMRVNFGEFGNRQILAGIKKSFSPEDLIGEQAVFVFNLKPRKMMGMESQGMMLIAENEQGDLEIIKPTHRVKEGTRLR